MKTASLLPNVHRSRAVSVRVKLSRKRRVILGRRSKNALKYEQRRGCRLPLVLARSRSPCNVHRPMSNGGNRSTSKIRLRCKVQRGQNSFNGQRLKFNVYKIRSTFKVQGSTFVIARPI